VSRSHAVTPRLAGAGVLVAAGWLALLSSGPVARAQYPEPSPANVVTTGDPRSEGEGPGLVGSPLEIAMGILVLGLVTVAGTAIIVRVTRRS
jgi:hypothetical protein